MDRTIRNTLYQVGSGAIVGLALDQTFPAPRSPTSLGDFAQQFIEIAGQSGLLIILMDAFTKTFKFSVQGTTIETMPFMLSVAGFSGNMMSKMGYVGKYASTWYRGFKLSQSVPTQASDIKDSKSPMGGVDTMSTSQPSDSTLSNAESLRYS